MIIPIIPDKELAYQARIKELREALNCPHCPNQGWFEDRDHNTGDSMQVQCEWCCTTPNSRFNVLSRPDDLSALEAYVREEKRKVLKNAAAVCEARAEDANLASYKPDSKHDKCAYYEADECAHAIRALIEELK